MTDRAGSCRSASASILLVGAETVSKGCLFLMSEGGVNPGAGQPAPAKEFRGYDVTFDFIDDSRGGHRLPSETTFNGTAGGGTCRFSGRRTVLLRRRARRRD